MKLNKKEKLIDKIICHMLQIEENSNTEILAVRLAEYNIKWLRALENVFDVLANQPSGDLDE